jgi:glycine oxidase
VSAGRRGARPADVAADLVVVGGGIVGLAITAAAADRGLSVALVTAERMGAASRAAAGLLVPHYGDGAAGAVERFMRAGRDLYPSYVQWVEEHSGTRVGFDASGAIELAWSPAECAALHSRAPDGAERLTATAVAGLEPTLAPTAGGLLYPSDGAVDSARLTDALAAVVGGLARARVVREAAAGLTFDRHSGTALGQAGTRVQGRRVVIAAGAWSAAIEGLPRPIPVRPLRGQICALSAAPLRHVVLGPDVYIVSRNDDRTIVGSTMEDVGFDVRTTPDAIDALRHAATVMCPALAGRPVVEAWSGLRPATPDLIPIIGPDPELPTLIYACGHSRNGILLAPITAAVVCAFATGADPEWDVSPFAIERFEKPGE